MLLARRTEETEPPRDIRKQGNERQQCKTRSQRNIPQVPDTLADLKWDAGIGASGMLLRVVSVMGMSTTWGG